MYVTYYKNHAFSLNNQIKLFTWSHIYDGFLPQHEMAHLKEKKFKKRQNCHLVFYEL